MRIAIPKESMLQEKRIAMLPSIVKKLKRFDLDIEIESGLGEALFFSDKEYEEAGASVNKDRKALLSNADIVFRVRPTPLEEIPYLKAGCLHISFLDPHREKDIIDHMLEKNIIGISLEMLPRTTLLQKMDALSSQANLAGYIAMMLASQKLKKIIPMMTTPAGTLPPARVFIIGVGVAGLQAIATAKRLGARVEAFDTRPVVEEQVKSLGAKFIKIDLGEMGQTKEGYAKALTEEQVHKQQEGMKNICAQSDIVITTAQVVGRPAPILITKEMVAVMKSGSVIVDMAVENGGNVEGSKLDETIEIDGVSILGIGNLPGKVAEHASQMYASNLFHLVDHFSTKGDLGFQLNLDDEHLKACILTKGQTNAY